MRLARVSSSLFHAAYPPLSNRIDVLWFIKQNGNNLCSDIYWIASKLPQRQKAKQKQRKRSITVRWQTFNFCHFSIILIQFVRERNFKEKNYQNELFYMKKESEMKELRVNEVNVENNNAFKKVLFPKYLSVCLCIRVRWFFSLRVWEREMLDNFCFLARRKSTWRSEEISYILNMLWGGTEAKTC